MKKYDKISKNKLQINISRVSGIIYNEELFLKIHKIVILLLFIYINYSFRYFANFCKIGKNLYSPLTSKKIKAISILIIYSIN